MVKEKLSEALRKKIEEIEEQRVKEQEEKNRIEKMTKKEKEKLKLKEARKNKAKKKTPIQEERDAHEAYQLILSEHHRRVKQRVKQKSRTLGLLNASLKAKTSEDSSPESDTDKYTVMFA